MKINWRLNVYQFLFAVMIGDSIKLDEIYFTINMNITSNPFLKFSFRYLEAGKSEI